MNKEIEFAKTLEAVRKTAALNGNTITREEVYEAFSPLALDDTQMGLVFDYLEKHKVGLDAPADLDEYLTDEETNYLNEYLQMLDTLSSLSEGEKEAAFLSAMAGEKSAQEKLIHAFLPKVADIAKLYTGQGVFLEDLIGQGNMALSEGVSMLGSQENAKDAERLLVNMIMDAMEELLAGQLQATEADKEMENKVNEVAQKAAAMAKELRRPVTVKELSEESGLEEDLIREVMRMSGNAIEDLVDKDGQ